MWRVICGVMLAWGLLGGVARADVFVPADPPAGVAMCPEAAGDVLASVRETPKERWYVAVSEAGGPWRRVSPLFLPMDGNICPVVSVAADGTAAVAVRRHLVVRPPGGSFGAPVRLRRSFEVADVAAAPGGWVAVTGRVYSPEGSDLAAAVVAPGAPARLATVARAEPDTSLVVPDVGIDAAGGATLAWVRDRWYGRSTVQTARFSGGAWEPPESLGATRYSEEVELDELDLAVSPAGRSLLAWPDRDGIMASVDGQAPQRLVAERRTGYPSVSVEDDGRALLAFAARGGQVRVVSRVAAGEWMPPVSLTAGPSPDPRVRDLLMQTTLTTLLAPDGRATVTWNGGDEHGAAAMAAWGRPGEAWSAGVRVSAATHDAGPPTAWLDERGVPRMMWEERAEDEHESRLRGARLASDAEAGPPDIAPPALNAELPLRTPRTKTARVRFRISVRCSEACDLRLRLVDPGSGDQLQTVTRALPAGRDVMLRFTTHWSFATRLLLDRRMRRPLIELLATDRAGNVSRRARPVAVRVVDRPILGFRVGPRHDFAMFTRAGNRAVGALVNDLISAIAAGTPERELRRRYRAGIRAIEDQGYDEVWDTAVGGEIFEALYVPCTRKGIDAEAIMG